MKDMRSDMEEKN